MIVSPCRGGRTRWRMRIGPSSPWRWRRCRRVHGFLVRLHDQRRIGRVLYIVSGRPRLRAAQKRPLLGIAPACGSLAGPGGRAGDWLPRRATPPGRRRRASRKRTRGRGGTRGGQGWATTTRPEKPGGEKRGERSREPSARRRPPGGTRWPARTAVHEADGENEPPPPCRTVTSRPLIGRARRTRASGRSGADAGHGGRGDN